MKKIAKRLIASSIVLGTIFSANSCDWLDVDPNLGVDEEEVFGSFKNLRKYFDYVYCEHQDFTEVINNSIFMGTTMLEEIGGSNRDFYTLDGTTDIADMGRPVRNIEYKQCALTWETVDRKNISNKPVSTAMWNIIRIANRTLEALPEINDCTQQEHDELTGYAYFTRAYAHFVLARKYGGVPYLDHSLGPNDEWDIVRVDAWDTFQKCAEDFYTAYVYLQKAGWMRRDGLPGEEGHLKSPTSQYPSGVSALAFRARALVYAASPLFNKKGKADWEQAAEACAFALTTAVDDWKFSLVPFSKITDLYLATGESEESIWAVVVKSKDNAKNFSAYFAYPQSYRNAATGVCPTQNFVDLYETKWGEPLNTKEDRDAAYAVTGEGSTGPDKLKHHYYDQDPYANLDPRFEATIVHDGSKNKFVMGTINIYKNESTGKWPITNISNTSMEFGKEWGTTDQDGNGYSVTGYYCKKYWEGQRGDKGASHGHVDNVFRLAELYLLYGEAVNEAYGPSGKAGKCDLTAADAINVVRNRAGMPDVQQRFLATTETFRPRIQNERMVELAFEGHYYYDIRRWMIAPERMGKPIEGMYITKLKKNPDKNIYPNGKTYERKALPETRQCTWKDCMYFFPFSQDQTHKMSLFTNNEIWH